MKDMENWIEELSVERQIRKKSKRTRVLDKKKYKNTGDKNGNWHRKISFWLWKVVKRKRWKEENLKSAKNPNPCREGKLQVLGYIGSGHHQASKNERKN